MRAIMLGFLASLSLAGAATADDKADIQALNDRFSAAASRGDGAAMGALYAPDAVMLPPDNSVVSGPAIGPYLAGLEKGVANLKLTTTDVVRLSPDFIREVGTASFDTIGDNPANVKGTYVVVWKRVGGTWKLWTDIFH
jgi:ketosteroid isomerase-like protein